MAMPGGPSHMGQDSLARSQAGSVFLFPLFHVKLRVPLPIHCRFFMSSCTLQNGSRRRPPFFG